MGRRTTLLLLLLALAACPQPLTPSRAEGTSTRTTLRLFLGGAPVAVIEESTSSPADAPRVVERTSRLLTSTSADVARLRATLDEDGLLREARYRREGPHGSRDVTLTSDGRTTTLATPHGRFEIAGGRSVVLLELLHHARPETKTSVTFVDVASAETLSGSVERDGASTVALDEHGAILARASHDPPARDGPGRFLESTLAPSSSRPATLHPVLAAPASYGALTLRGIDGIPREALALDATGQRALAGDPAVAFDASHRDTTRPTSAHTIAAPFLEVDHPAVVGFPSRHASTGIPAADALAIAEAIHELIDTTKGGSPPSAVGTLTRKAGDCDDATALLVAALRARGHAARPVVGYRHYAGRLVPHAWAEVYDGSAWLPVDALVPGLGPFPTHLRLFEGLGSPLTMGRVLGSLHVESRPQDATKTRAAR